MAVKINTFYSSEQSNAPVVNQTIAEEEYFQGGSLRDILSSYFYKGLIREETNSNKKFLDENLITFVLSQILK